MGDAPFTKPRVPKRSIMSIIERSIELIENGWCQGVTHQHQVGGPTSYCLMGAIFEATAQQEPDPATRTNLNTATQKHVLKTLHATRPEPEWLRLWQFNDRTATTKRDILGLLHDAHQQLEATP